MGFAIFVHAQNCNLFIEEENSHHQNSFSIAALDEQGRFKLTAIELLLQISTRGQYKFSMERGYKINLQVSEANIREKNTSNMFYSFSMDMQSPKELTSQDQEKYTVNMQVKVTCLSPPYLLSWIDTISHS